MIVAPLWLWSLLVGLLALSGTCSASEAALFSLTPPERERAGGPTKRLLERPKSLLVTVLLLNLVINILFFAFADRLFRGLESPTPLWIQLANLFGALLVLVVFGEILPKTLALRGRVPLSVWTAPVWLVLVEALGPVRRALVSLMDLFGDLAERGGDERVLTADELGRVLASSAGTGGLELREANLLGEIVELSAMRVREIMTPRVDGLFLELDGSNRDEITSRALEQRISWLPVMDELPDEIRGSVRVRDLLVWPERAIASLTMPVLFIPEVASCMDLLKEFRERKATEAVCVDEWGGTAGYVTVEDVFEELVGELRVEGESREAEVVPLGEGAYRVPGLLSIRDWNERFGARVVPTEFETVGGLVTALLGRIPRPGDCVTYGNLGMEVGEVRGRRVDWVRLELLENAMAEGKAQ